MLSQETVMLVILDLAAVFMMYTVYTVKCLL